jgi:hypothetical protein
MEDERNPDKPDRSATIVVTQGIETHTHNNAGRGAESLEKPS